LEVRLVGQTGDAIMSHPTRPDVDRELAKLKAFQRDTVDHVFGRMYDETAPARRFLVADEVGLGKTLVARGVVTKVIDRLWDSVDRIDIIYICSNGSIARQNIGRLNVSGSHDATLPSRITLLPKVVRGLKNRKLNFISLTPQTSFDLKSNLGTYEERALLFWLVPDDWKESKTAVRNLLQGMADRDRFKWQIEQFDHSAVDPELRDAFRAYLAERPEQKIEFLNAVERFQLWRENVPDEDRNAQRDTIGRLRAGLATSCLNALEPDLVILDEFQRFKHLLDGTDKAGDLAQGLFSFGDTRVLLLSATPYKMYTTAEEVDTDDHFRDFIQTVRFLQNDPVRTSVFQSRLRRYRDNVFALGAGGRETLVDAKQAVEDSLRVVMVRTERLAASADRNGMLTEVISSSRLAVDEVSAFLCYARVAEALQHSDVTEYWKSSPYLLDEYEFKRDFVEGVKRPNVSQQLSMAIASAPAALLPWEDVERYRVLDPANARLRHLLADTLGGGAWRQLWLPASLPYYRTAGAYTEGGIGTKRLVFSSWQVVPKVVAATLTYEAERRMFGESFEVERPNTPEARDRLTQRLRGLPLLTVSYPCVALAKWGDPLELRRASADEGLPAAIDVFQAVRARVHSGLASVLPEVASAGAPDPAWYWAAPLFLDLADDEQATRQWVGQENLADVWRTDPEAEDAGEESTAADDWATHVAQFRRMADRQISLGPPPPDLPDVLAKVALAGPAVVALRALSRLFGDDSRKVVSIRNNAGWIASGFRTLFNLPEVTAMLRRGVVAPTDDRYWEQVLDYCVDGGIQAVMDEYAHVAQEWLGVAYKPMRQAAAEISRTVATVMQLRTAQVGVHSISTDGATLTLSDRRMRARFAARFGARQTDEGAGAMRADDVRLAFNSPFWPFVLCSTSVGQEGLDFHLYCHAVVHWNLPSNPVDLEQREGRVHRYKGHAIRKNAALLYGEQALVSDAPDPWQRMFETAHLSAPAATSDLVPYWILAAEGGAKIERHLPMLPLSRDVERADALRKALTVYRMAFGQNRQDDVVAYLTSRFPPEEIQLIAEMLRIDLAPAKLTGQRTSTDPWSREVETDSGPGAVPASVYRSVTLPAARALLDEFVVIRNRQSRTGLETYNDLLDRFGLLRTKGA
jgi:hypothetical protein